MKKQQPLQKTQRPPAKDRPENHETYLAPPPPLKGRIIGLDCHPDTFTAAVFRGSTPHDAVKLSSHPDMSLKRLLEWAAKEFTKGDLFLIEAGSNSFEIHRRLLALGLRAAVMESCHVGKQAKTYADNDKMAAARIALVYLQGNAPCVWIPDAATCERRELLHAYSKVVADHTAAGNALKGNRNIAVAAVARKLLVQVWHLLSGNPPEALETDKSLTIKLNKLAVNLGKGQRAGISLPASLTDCVNHLRERIGAPSAAPPQEVPRMNRPGKLSTRTRRSDELRIGPFSRRNLVDNFPPSPLPSTPHQNHPNNNFPKEKT